MGKYENSGENTYNTTFSGTSQTFVSYLNSLDNI